MKSRLNFFLLKLPVISIALFFVLTTIAAIYYPGSVREGIGFECNHYSFTHNFLSELGTFEVNSDETNPFAIKSDNTFSMILFNFSLLIIGFCIVCFYISFSKLFIFIKDNSKAILYAKISTPLGVIAGVFYAGVGLVPHDLNFFWHVFFANGAFLTMFFVCFFHTMSIAKSEYISNIYAIGYVSFMVFLGFYLYIIFLGPQIGPGIDYTEADLMLQVVSQKCIVLIFIFSILFQVLGIKKALQNSN